MNDKSKVGPVQNGNESFVAEKAEGGSEAISLIVAASASLVANAGKDVMPPEQKLASTYLEKARRLLSGKQSKVKQDRV